MKHLYEPDIERLANCIAKTSELTAIISVASCIGRTRTEKEYRKVMPKMLIDKLNNNGCAIINNYSDGYSDRVTPMRYELLVIKRPLFYW
jgi:hypothetical protein